MIKAYTAANLQDAHILLGLLHAEGIDARIFNANAQGGVGEIPFTNTYPELWLVHERDLPCARSIFAAFERPTGSVQSNQCVACGEENPPRFEICWNCQRPTGSN
jgi:hypothetical protein